MTTNYSLLSAFTVALITFGTADTQAQSRAEIQAGRPHVHPGSFHAEMRGGNPLNDSCSAAEPLTVGVDCTNPTSGDNSSADQSMLGPTCDPNSDSLFADVWYTFNSGANTAVDVTLVASDLMTDWVLVVMDGCSGSELYCVIQPTILPQNVPVTANTDYVVRVYSNLQYGSWGPFTICVSSPAPPPANDDCAGAISITPGVECVSTTGTVLSATESLPADSCNGFLGAADDDVWYMFVATQPVLTVGVLGSTGFDAVVEVFDGACGAGAPIGCADSTVTGESENVVLSSLVVGETYYYRLFHYGTLTPADPTFTTCVVEGDGISIGIGESDRSELFSVYPNPTEGDLTVTWAGASGSVRVELLDMTGRIAFSEQRMLTTGQRTELSLKGVLAQGSYALRLTGAGQQAEQRVVVR
jgi:hypothetical protein